MSIPAPKTRPLDSQSRVAQLASERRQRAMARQHEIAQKIAGRNQALREKALERQRKLREKQSRRLAEAPARSAEFGALLGVGAASYLARRITDCPIVEEFAMALGAPMAQLLGSG